MKNVQDGSIIFASFRSLLMAGLTLATCMGAATAAEDTGTAGHSAAHLSRLHEDAQQGSPLAQYLLGAFYQLGEAVPQDYTEAANWYERAADQGLAVAQFALGALYARGEGGPEDLVRSHMWLSLAAHHTARIVGAEKLLRDAELLRGDVAQRMSPEQMLEAEKLAREWKPKSER